MFQSWRHQIAQAEKAFHEGRLNDVCRLLRREKLAQYAPGQQLAGKVVAQLLDRATGGLKQGEFRGAWQDCDLAKTIGEQCHNDYSQHVESLRNELVERCLNEVENLLAKSEIKTALSLIEFLESLPTRHNRLSCLQQVARCLLLAQELARQGDFSQADEQFKTALRLLPNLATLNDRRKQCQDHLIHSRKLKDKLRMALLGEDWDKTLEVADQLLEIAPESKLGLDAKRRAWEKVDRDRCTATDIAEKPGARFEEPNSLSVTTCMRSSETMAESQRSSRFLLWVDAVGGFLVCLSNEVIVGQALPDAEADIPILGDLSKQHAKIRREGEDYLIEPLSEVRVRGRTITGTRLLTDGDEVELGNAVVFRYRKPHALSASARLELASRHRTEPWADGVLLMAESCVLGPNHSNHVVCRDWMDDVVLFRQDDGLYCRGMASLEIDGEHYDGAGRVSYNSRIAGNDFSMSLEQI